MKTCFYVQENTETSTWQHMKLKTHDRFHLALMKNTHSQFLIIYRNIWLQFMIVFFYNKTILNSF